MSGTINRLDRNAIESMYGYRPFTTFWEDFSLAEPFGVAAILDTYTRAFNEWKGEYKYVTELTMVLNWKGWNWYFKKDPNSQQYSRTYFELYEKTKEWCYNNLKGDELTYYCNTTD